MKQVKSLRSMENDRI